MDHLELVMSTLLITLRTSIPNSSLELLIVMIQYPIYYYRHLDTITLTQRSTTTKSTLFYVIFLVMFSGPPMMFVSIITRKTQNVLMPI